MALTQHILNYLDYLAAGGEKPIAYSPTDTTVVIVGRNDDGSIAWVSYAEADVPVAERLNPSAPAQDWRP